MRKQKLRKISTKILLTIFLIDTIYIFGFSTSTLATTTLSFNATLEVSIKDEITISWRVIILLNTNPYYIYEGYYSDLYISVDNGDTW